MSACRTQISWKAVPLQGHTLRRLARTRKGNEIQESDLMAVDEVLKCSVYGLVGAKETVVALTGVDQVMSVARFSAV